MAITITEQQIKILEPYAYENYISELVEHCNKKYPHLQKTIGEEKLRATLNQGVEKASQSGFTQRGPVRFYIELLIIFGWSFETDPQYSWIQESLQKNHNQSQIDISMKLYGEVDKFLDSIYGENKINLFFVGNKLEQLTLDNAKVSRNHFTQDMLALLQETYPQKYQFTEKGQLIKLVEEGIYKSRTDYQFDQANHIALIIILMFYFGHTFDHDPFYQWAAIEKSNQYIEGTLVTNHQEVIAKKLESRSKIWLSAAIQNGQ
jgi:hypothetical protein